MIKASTPEKIVVTILGRIVYQEDGKPRPVLGYDTPIELEDLVGYLVECQKRGEIDTNYELLLSSGGKDPREHNLQRIYGNGQILGLEVEKDGRLRIGDMGLGFSTFMELPLKIEEAMKEYPFSVHLRRKAIHSVPQEPGEVVELDDYRE